MELLHGPKLERTDVAPHAGRPDVHTLVYVQHVARGVGAVRRTDGVDGWTAGQESMSQGGATVVGKCAQQRVGILQVARLNETSDNGYRC